MVPKVYEPIWFYFYIMTSTYVALGYYYYDHHHHSFTLTSILSCLWYTGSLDIPE
jgi:hypothetical protein